jgi:hypothetical protein
MTLSLRDLSSIQGISRVRNNEPNGIETATHNTSAKENQDIIGVHIQVYFANVWWVSFLVPSGSLSLMKYLVYVLQAP